MSPFLLIVTIALQAALMHFHHFMPDERLSTWHALRFGAVPPARFWVVALLAAVVWALQALLVFAQVPQIAGDHVYDRLIRFAPLWLLATACAWGVHHWGIAARIRLPTGAMLRQHLARAGVCALLTLLAMLAAIVFTSVAPTGTNVPQLAGTVLRAALPALVVLALIAAARARAVHLRRVPLIGTLLHAAASTGSLLMGARLIADLAQPAARGALLYSGLEGIDLPVRILMQLGAALAVAAWLLPSSRAAKSS